MLKTLLRERTRRRLRAQTAHPVMQAYLDTPAPAPSQYVEDLEFLALDLELSGLDAAHDRIVSVGYITIKANQVLMRSAVHHYVGEPDIDLQHTAPIHNIRNQDLEDGRPLTEVMDAVLEALQGKVLVLHHEPLDHAFLDQACVALYGTPLLAPVVDTLSLEQRLRRHDSMPAGAFRLHACRNRYGLPAYTAHNAITDAIATAELWLAQLSHSSSGKSVKLGDYV